MLSEEKLYKLHREFDIYMETGAYTPRLLIYFIIIALESIHVPDTIVITLADIRLATTISGRICRILKDEKIPYTIVEGKYLNFPDYFKKIIFKSTSELQENEFSLYFPTINT